MVSSRNAERRESILAACCQFDATRMYAWAIRPDVLGNALPICCNPSSWVGRAPVGFGGIPPETLRLPLGPPALWVSFGVRTKLLFSAAAFAARPRFLRGLRAVFALRFLFCRPPTPRPFFADSAKNPSSSAAAFAAAWRSWTMVSERSTYNSAYGVRRQHLVQLNW